MLALLDNIAPASLETAIREIGYIPLRLPPHPCLPAPVASHPDMLLFFAPNAIYCTKSYAKIAKDEIAIISEHAQKTIIHLEDDYGGEYPKDVLLNALAMGDRLLCHPAATAHEIRHCYAGGMIPVAQGYAKCSAVPIGNSSLITADPSIAHAASQTGFDVLRIREGAIRLEGYSYGFIGGCASASPYKKIDTVYFCGNLNAHPDAARIVDFCKLRGVSVRSLGFFPLTDVGTIFLI
jgi:hypothetical protein